MAEGDDQRSLNAMPFADKSQCRIFPPHEPRPIVKIENGNREGHRHNNDPLVDATPTRFLTFLTRTLELGCPMPDFDALSLHVFCGDCERRTEEWRRNSSDLFKVPRKANALAEGDIWGSEIVKYMYVSGQEDECNQASVQALGTTTMKSLALLLSAAASLASASAFAIDQDSSLSIPAGASITLPRAETLSSLSRRGNSGCSPKPNKDNWGNALEKDRKKITIRESKHDRDDISDDFLWAIKKANNGGLVHLQKGKKYVIGKKLDLSFLKDVYVKIDGELKVRPDCLSFGGRMILTPPQFTDDIKYWQANNFYYPFQKSITFWVWGGK